MKWRVLEDREGARTYAVVGDEGDDAVEIINQFAREQELTAAQLTAVGAFSRATVGWFDREAKDYRRIEIAEQCEVLSLLGDIAAAKDGPVAHLHAVLGLSDGRVRGGHLLAGSVWPTLEVVARETPSCLRKSERPDIGLALIDLQPKDVVAAVAKVLDKPRPVTSVPTWRGLQVRLADAAPRFAMRAIPLIVVQGRRAQRKLRANGGPR